MPIYTYKCPQGHESDHLFPFGKKPQAIVCHCKKRAIYKLSMPAIIMKGPGFTRTAKDTSSQHTEKFYKENGLVPKEDIVVDVDQYLKTAPQ